MEGLTPGRLVHYVYRDDEAGVHSYCAGESRAAIIVRLFEHKGGDQGVANLLVLPDGSNDLLLLTEGTQHGYEPILWRTSVRHDPDQTPGTWHWIPKA